jgi:hypothetical protein
MSLHHLSTLPATQSNDGVEARGRLHVLGLLLMEYLWFGVRRVLVSGCRAPQLQKAMATSSLASVGCSVGRKSICRGLGEPLAIGERVARCSVCEGGSADTHVQTTRTWASGATPQVQPRSLRNLGVRRRALPAANDKAARARSAGMGAL